MAPPVRPRSGTARKEAAEAELVLCGRAWVAGRLQPLEVGIDGEGTIRAIGRNVRGARRHDVGERVLLPAATDVHVHLRDPGPEAEVETIASGTVGAALGGVGLVGEMPNTEPAVTSVERLEEKEARVRGRAATDVLLYAAALEPRALAALARRAGGFKLYLAPTTGIDPAPEAGQLDALLAELAHHDLPLAVHAEDPGRFRTGLAAVDPVSWDERRPVDAEESAVRRLLAASAWLRLHVAHATAAPIVALARARGVSCEVTAQHLLLSNASGRDGRFKVNPPLRSELARAALWREFAEGRVPILASDHAPHAALAKALPFDVAPSGVPGVQTTVPLMLAKVGEGKLALDVLLRAACDRPARLLGQPMGRIAPGHRANLLVVEFRSRRPIRGAQLRSPCGWSPFEGFPAVFPVEHWHDGERVVDGGEYVGRPCGRVVRPEYAPAAPARLPPPERA